MQSDLDKIKEILFGHEKKAIDAITRRLETPESRTADVADVLADAVTTSARQSDRLQRALREPVEQTITETIQRDPERFADALFPVIGPAIRKAISEAMRSLVQSINRAVDTSLSPTARLKAWREGVPLAEWVLRRSLVFRVDEVFLIDPRTGLLIEHARHRDAGGKDEDAVSAMLTAIQDFVRDSFSEGGGELESAAVGEYTVWLSHGPYAMLAAVIRGTPPSGIRKVFDETVERLHLYHATALKGFSGARLPQLEPELEPCLQLQLRSDAQQTRSGLPLSVTLLLLVAAAGLAWWLFQSWRLDRDLASWRAALEAQPGLVVTTVARDGKDFYARGLRDPLAADPVALAQAQSLDPARLHTDFRAYQSLEPAMVEARVRAKLAPPDGVSVRLVDGVLTAQGAAPAPWRERVEQIGPAMEGVTALDLSGLTTSDAELFARVRAATSPPGSVALRVSDGMAIMEGEAPAAWIADLPRALGTVEGLRGSDRSGLRSVERAALERLAMAIDGHEIRFVSDITLSAEQASAVQSLASKMLEFADNAEALNIVPAFYLTGYTDGSGTAALNRTLRSRRADAVRQRLVVAGVHPDWLLIRVGQDGVDDGRPDPALRKVRVTVDRRALNGNATRR